MELRKVFPNGLRAIADPIDRRYAVLKVGIDVGAKNESRGKKGGAHLLEHMMFRSNEFRTSDQIAEDSEFHGLYTNAHTSLTETTIKITFPPNHLSLAVELAYQAVKSRQLKLNFE
ncbi:insulinase family protein [Candidatus Woesearchaeota archaeon]|nr:insulinase family protein [Candidatus Woesearchaeota archaeon]